MLQSTEFYFLCRFILIPCGFPQASCHFSLPSLISAPLLQNEALRISPPSLWTPFPCPQASRLLPHALFSKHASDHSMPLIKIWPTRPPQSPATGPDTAPPELHSPSFGPCPLSPWSSFPSFSFPYGVPFIWKYSPRVVLLKASPERAS